MPISSEQPFALLIAQRAAETVTAQFARQGVVDLHRPTVPFPGLMEVKAYGSGGCYLAAGMRGMRVEEILVTHVVTENCINCKYTDCVEVCPVDCFHAGPNMLVIDPDECIDCTLCVEECPVDAIFPEEEVPSGQEHFLELNRQLAPQWPVLARKIPEPEDAKQWDGVPGKLALLRR